MLSIRTASVLLWIFVLEFSSVGIVSGASATAAALQEGGPRPQAAREGLHLTLEKAINMALHANRNILQSEYGLENDVLSLEKAKSDFDLKLLPNAEVGVTGEDDDNDRSLGAGLSLEKRLSSGSRLFLQPRFTSTEDEYENAVGVFLEKPLLKGAGKEVVFNSVRTAEHSVRASQRTYHRTKIRTVVAAVSAFYDVAKQRALVRLNRDLAEKLRRHAQAASAKEKVGMATPIDVYRAKIQLKNAEDRLSAVSEALQSAKDELRSTLALPLYTRLTIEAPLEYRMVTMTESEAVRIALENRVELEQVADDLAEAKREASIAKHNTLPELNLVAGYSRLGTSETLDSSFAFDENQWELRLVSTTDFARSAEKLTYQQKRNAIRTVKVQSNQVEESIAKEARSQLRSLNQSRERMTIKQEQIQQAEGKLALAQVKFDYGMADNFDLIESEIELQQARSDLLVAEIDYIIGLYRFRAALGTLVEWAPKAS